MTLIDFKQPSTWRGILGLTGLIGWNLSPELRDQIATGLVALLCLIEMLRNEYRDPNATDPGRHETPIPDDPDGAASVQPVDRLRGATRLPPVDNPPRPNSGFNQR